LRAAADTAFVLRKLRDERGWGMIELLLALTILNIGLLALVASLNSGIVAVKRASKISTAATLADTQMELYRAIRYSDLALDDNATKNFTDATYQADPVLGGNVNNSVTTTTGCSGMPNYCNPSRTVLGADRKQYRVDSYITWSTPTSGRQLKLVTIVVREAQAPFARLSRQQSTFDESTGL
jgi:type II secretory pathway pseudopilin PulG